jgi:hypothetical protein
MTSIAKGQGGAAGFLEDLNGAVRDNPVAAGLVGAGLLWMLLGSQRIASLANGVPDAAHSASNWARKVSEAAGTAAAGTTNAAEEAVRHAGESAKAAAEQAADNVNSAGQNAGHSLSGFGRETGQAVQTTLAVTLDEHPLVLGAVGLGIGVAIASMFSPTAMEQEVAGAASRKVQDRFHDLAGEATKQTDKVFDEVKREAAEQGLTRAAAGEMLESAAMKIKATATAARESIQSGSSQL